MSLTVSSVCLACGAQALVAGKEVPLVDLARAWSRLRRLKSLAPVSVETWLEAAMASIGRSSVRFDRCPRCGLQVSAPLTPWREGAFPEDEEYPPRWEFDRCLEDLGPRPLRILELGCGAGEFLEMARRRGHDTLGVDFNPTAVEAAVARGLHVVHGGLDRLREHLAARGDDLVFDAVVLFHVIEHLADPVALLHELTPFVRRGTRLVVSCPGPRRFTRMIREQRIAGWDFWDYPPHHVLRWTLPSLTRFLSFHGWRVLAAVEEPLHFVGASSQIGCTRAMYRGRLNRSVYRRASIVWARIRLAAARTMRIRGLSIYVMAECAAPGGVR